MVFGHLKAFFWLQKLVIMIALQIEDISRKLYCAYLFSWVSLGWSIRAEVHPTKTNQIENALKVANLHCPCPLSIWSRIKRILC